MAKSSVQNKKYLALWEQYSENEKRDSPIDLNETASQKRKRISDLENIPEKWFAYYFPTHYKCEPAVFHTKGTHRILNNPEWMESRCWSRELAKTTRTRMEVLYLVLTGKKRNVLLVSNTEDNAQRLLLPYKVALEANQRIINDYGKQQKLGSWEAGEFVTQKKASFRAIGAGQSPRGTNNDAVRPDVILIDDIDTDEECRNPKRIEDKVRWVFEALIPTRSVSEPLLFIACGNIIAKYCTITELNKQADNIDIVNIRNEKGKSTWPNKNTEELIDRVLSKIPWSSQQKEYFNNPVSEGDTFKEITFGKCPKLSSCDEVVIYADPSTSNKDRGKTKQASYKSVGVIGAKGRKRYLYKIFLEQTKNATFVEWLYECYLYCKENDVDTLRVWIESNSLQHPFYEQVIEPLIETLSEEYGFMLPVREDTRKKPEKYFRIEGTLEPLNRLGNLIFNIKEKDNPHMKTMESQMLGVSENATVLDGPDMLEGGVHKLNKKFFQKSTTYEFSARPSRGY